MALWKYYNCQWKISVASCKGIWILGGMYSILFQCYDLAALLDGKLTPEVCRQYHLNKWIMHAYESKFDFLYMWYIGALDILQVYYILLDMVDFLFL